MSNVNDTDGARVVDGYYDKTTKLGSRQRIHPEAGGLGYDPKSKAFEEWEEGDEDSVTFLKSTGMGAADKIDNGALNRQALQFGLPKHIQGTPLGCGCQTAHLAGATKPVGSHIEADYMCDSGWHNYVYFELIGFENKGESKLKVDVNGNLIEDEKQETKELGDY